MARRELLTSSPLVRMARPSSARSSYSWTAMCHLYTMSAVSLPPSATEALEVGEQEGMREETRSVDQRKGAIQRA